MSVPGKLIDLKGGLFWLSYYGAWIYAVYKNGLPGQVVPPELDEMTTITGATTSDSSVIEKEAIAKSVSELMKQVTEADQKVTEELRKSETSGENNNIKPISAEARKAAENAAQVIEGAAKILSENKDAFGGIQNAFTFATGGGGDILPSQPPQQQPPQQPISSPPMSETIEAPGKTKSTSISGKVAEFRRNVESVMRSSNSNHSFEEQAKKAINEITQDGVVVAKKIAHDIIPVMAEKANEFAHETAAPIAQKAREFVRELAHDAAPIVEKVIHDVESEVPHIADRACREAKSIATQLAHDLPEIGHKIERIVVTEISGKCRKQTSSPSSPSSSSTLTPGIADSMSGSSSGTMSPISTSSSSALPPIAESIAAGNVADEAVVATGATGESRFGLPSVATINRLIPYHLVDAVNHALGPDMSASSTEDRNNWPRSTGLNEWPTNDSK